MLSMDATKATTTRRVGVRLGGAAIAVGLIAMVVMNARREAAQVAALDGATRHELFERTLANLRTCTAQQGLAATAFCEEQARFARQFAECDEACRELTQPWLSAHR